MSIINESTKQQDNILTNQIKKELNLLPKIIREKKIEIDIATREIVIFKEKISFLNKELKKINLNIMSLEKDYSILLMKTDSIKTHQKILLNSLNNEIPFNLNSYIENNNNIKELMLIFFNFENDFSELLSMVFDNHSNELASLLIGSYSYLKMLQIDFSQKYNQIKNKINNILNELKDMEDKMPICLIITYIKNIFKLLDNKEKTLIFEKKIENYSIKKNEIFSKLEIIEDKKKEKENNLNLIDNYINEIFIILEKYKLYSKYSKTKIINNKDNTANKDNKICINKNGNNSGNNLNVSCPNNPLFKKDIRISSNNEERNTSNKISYINIDLTNKYSEKDKINSKKTIDSADDTNIKMNNTNSVLKKINISNYSNINDLEKDIYSQITDLKNNPLYRIKVTNGIKNKLNNDIGNLNININNVNKNNLLSKNKKIKNFMNKNNEYGKKKISTNKSYNKNKIEKKDKFINHENNNIIINNSNEVNKSNASNDTNNKSIKIKNYTSSSNYIKKNSPIQKKIKKINQNQKHKEGKVKLIPYLTHDYQINKDSQRKSNEPNIRKKIGNKDRKILLKTRSPKNSPNKNLVNINNINNKNISLFTNLDNYNCNTEQLTDKANQSSFAKISKKNIYISIKHNKTNLCKENLIDRNSKEKKNKKSLNKIKVNISKKEINLINNSNNKELIGRKNYPDKQPNSHLLNILNSEENNKINLKEKQKTKEITKINIDFDKYKNKSPKLKQRKYFDKFNGRINNKINTDDDNNHIIENIEIKFMNNSLTNNNININKNCHIIPFKNYKNKKSNTSYIVDKKVNYKNNKGNKIIKTNIDSNDSEKNKNIEENGNFKEMNMNNNSEIVTNLIRKELSNYSFNKKENKNHKKSYFQI